MYTIAGDDTFDASISIPEDMIDEVNVTTVNQGMQALADRTTFLKNRLGWQRLVNVFSVTDSTASLVLDNEATSSYSDSVKTELISIATFSGDILEVDVFGHVNAAAASAQAFQLATTLNVPTSPVGITGAEVVYDILDSATIPISLCGVIASCQFGATQIWIQSHGNGSDAGYVRGPYTVRVRQYRSTT